MSLGLTCTFEIEGLWHIHTIQDSPWQTIQGPNLIGTNMSCKSNTCKIVSTTFERTLTHLQCMYKVWLLNKRNHFYHFRNTTLRAANILISSVRFFKSFKEGCLLPDVFHMKPQKTSNPSYWNKVEWMPRRFATYLSYTMQVFPLDMSQFVNLFQSTRIPLPEKDEIRRFPDAKHILIIHRGRFFTFDVLDENGCLYEPNYYLTAIKDILQVE